MVTIEKISKYPELARGFFEAFPVATQVGRIESIPFAPQKDITRLSLNEEQLPIITQVLSQTRTREAYEAVEDVLPDPDLHRQTTMGLLIEYTTAILAREKANWEMEENRLGKVPFGIPGPGTEAVFIANERWAKKNDAILHYYRYEASDLKRGGSLRAMMAGNTGSISDSHTGGRNLPEHVASPEHGEVVATSYVAGHTLTAVGIAKALELRKRLGLTGNWGRFNDPEAITYCYIGDAGMAEGEAMETVREMCMHDGAPMILTVIDNGLGISTSSADGAVGGDCISYCRGYEQYGLKILEVDGTNLQDLFDKSREATECARINRKPVVFRIYNVPRIENHSTSDYQPRYMVPSDVKAMMAKDPIPLFKKYLIDHQVATDDELVQIDTLAHDKVREIGRLVLNEPKPDPKDLYKHVYAGPFTYEPARLSNDGWKSERAATIDLLQDSEEVGVNYLTEYAEDTFEISMRQAINIALAEVMKEDPTIIVFGQDVADFSTDIWERLDELFEQKFHIFQEKHPDVLNETDFIHLKSILNQVRQGKGYDVEPNDFALLAAIVEGKGGVFKTTQFLQMMFGRNRVWNSALAEASIIGTATGMAIAGMTPVVEIQFLPYLDPARNQLRNQLATLLWRSNGQFDAGMVIRIQGMNRLGGVAAMGHGGANIGELINIPGLRVVMPAHANEAGPLFKEALRLARIHRQPVIFVESIERLNRSKGFYQGPDAHIPLGQAEIRQRGEDFLVLTWSNNLPLVEEAAEKWRKQGIIPTIVNMRSLGVETDWYTIVQLINKHGKVMIVEAERPTSSAGTNLAAVIFKHLFRNLDAPIIQLSAREIRTSAGAANEYYELPQIPEIYEAGVELSGY